MGLAYNNIQDVSPLVGLTTLTELDLRGNPIEDINPLYTLLSQNPGIKIYLADLAPLTPKPISVLQTLVLISGDRQEGLPGVALAEPFVVEARDQTGEPLRGVQVTFTVTRGGGTLSVTTATTGITGRAGSVLTLGPNPGENTVTVSAEEVESELVFTASAVEVAKTPTFTLSIPAGVHAIHIPLRVHQVNGKDHTIETVGDVYNALGDAVNFVISLSADGNWVSYLSNISAGSVADATLRDDTGLIVVMKRAATLELAGDALGTDGVSRIDIAVGNNLVGVPLATKGMMISDLLVANVIAVAVSKTTGDGFLTITSADDEDDRPIEGGVSYLVIATAAGSIPITGSTWANEGVASAPTVAFNSSQTPVLHVDGRIVNEFDMLSQIPKLRVTVKNLSTGASYDIERETGNAISATLVAFDHRAMRVGDVLEITARSPNPHVGIRPVPQIVVTTEDVSRHRIRLPDLELYEIPEETALLANYPNPFNPETWIPYRLARPVEVTLTIYDVAGHLVRSLEIGFKPADVYESRASAIYWDGRNADGEHVAGGVYFYTLTAGTFTATRKFVIQK